MPGLVRHITACAVTHGVMQSAGVSRSASASGAMCNAALIAVSASCSIL